MIDRRRVDVTWAHTELSKHFSGQWTVINDVLIALWDRAANSNTLGGEQAGGPGSPPPAVDEAGASAEAEPAAPRRIVCMSKRYDETIVAVDDGTVWSLEYSVASYKWVWTQLPSVPQPEEVNDE